MEPTDRDARSSQTTDDGSRLVIREANRRDVPSLVRAAQRFLDTGVRPAGRPGRAPRPGA